MSEYMMFYLLDGHTPVPIRRGDYEALRRWDTWFGETLNTGERQVAGATHLPGGHVVSTCFFGFDQRMFMPGPPELFETRIFEGPWEMYYDRDYQTWEEAEAGHWRAVARLLVGLPPFDYIEPLPQLAPPIYLGLFDERKVAAMSDDELGLAVAQFNELYRRNYLDPVDWAVAVLKQAMVSGLQPWQVCAPVAEPLEELFPGFAEDQKIQRHTA